MNPEEVRKEYMKGCTGEHDPCKDCFDGAIRAVVKSVREQCAGEALNVTVRGCGIGCVWIPIAGFICWAAVEIASIVWGK